MKTVWWLLLCAFGLVCSCQKEEDVAVSVPAPVAVADSTTPSFVGQKGGSGKLSTRATDDTWSVGDNIGIYMLKKSGDEFNYDLSNAAGLQYVNQQYTVANETDAENGTLTPAAGQGMFYPISGDPVRFVAYYPYVSTADMPSANTLTFDFTDQNSQDKKEDLDFVFHRGTQGYNKSNPNVKLEFEHRFSKIRITVKQGAGGPSLENMEVKLINMPKSATVNLASLALEEYPWITPDDGSSTESTEITPWVTYDATTKEATVEAIVAPHTGEGNFAERKFIFTTTDGIEYTHKLEDYWTFYSGSECNFTLTLMPLKRLLHDGLTNSYMVKPKGESKTFTVLRAYARNRLGLTEKLHVDYPAGDKYTGKFGIDVVWEDPLGLIDMTGTTVDGEGHQAMITVKTTAADVKGNAVVKIFKKDDPDKTPVWSYHIWVTDYDPDNGDATWTNTHQTKKTYTFMDRHLGAIEAEISIPGIGLLYQWGRKDPFPVGRDGATGFAALNKFEGMPDAGDKTVYQTSYNDNDECIKESIMNPTRYFIHRLTNTVSWLPDGQSNLWNNGADTDEFEKTIYDPCPDKWRVPTMAYGSVGTRKTADYPWYGATLSRKSGTIWGWAFDENSLWPPTGYRETYADKGGEYRFPNELCISTASTETYYCILLYVYTGTRIEYVAFDQADANGIRCVLENP